MDTVYQKRIGNFELVIKRDDYAPSPRDADNVGQFWADGMHRRYNFHEEGADDVLARIKSAEISYLGTKADTDSWDDHDWIRYLMSVSEGRKHGEDGVKAQIRWQLADEHKALIEDW